MLPPMSKEISCLSMGTKIKRIYMLGEYDEETMIIQFEDSIQIVSMFGRIKMVTEC